MNRNISEYEDARQALLNTAGVRHTLPVLSDSDEQTG